MCRAGLCLPHVLPGEVQQVSGGGLLQRAQRRLPVDAAIWWVSFLHRLHLRASCTVLDSIASRFFRPLSLMAQLSLGTCTAVLAKAAPKREVGASFWAHFQQ